MPSLSSDILRTIFSASSKFPSIVTVLTPDIIDCVTLPTATFPSGSTTIEFKPARAAYAEAAAEVFPVDAQISVRDRSTYDFATNSTMPRTLHEAGGFKP